MLYVLSFERIILSFPVAEKRCNHFESGDGGLAPALKIVVRLFITPYVCKGYVRCYCAVHIRVLLQISLLKQIK